jgi:hypothetical protein
VKGEDGPATEVAATVTKSAFADCVASGG